MTFVSFAQNFEDVLLWRALKDVERGFYVDVGAQHPTIDSVSRAFSDRGWRGIHIEPSPQYAALLRAEHPGDVVMEAAVGSVRQKVTFHHVPNTGLSTLDGAARDAAQSQNFAVEELVVNMILLDDVLENIDEPVHWLKIDVEGYEAEVIRGWTGPCRPWILVVESTLPGKLTKTNRAWEPDILAKGYQYVWFDGLNRFYVHKDHVDLAERLALAPNVFDEAALSGEATSHFTLLLRNRIHALEQELNTLRSPRANRKTKRLR